MISSRNELEKTYGTMFKEIHDQKIQKLKLYSKKGPGGISTVITGQS